MQDRSIFSRVDLLAGKHRIDATAQTPGVREGEQQLHRLVGDTLPREVEQQIHFKPREARKTILGPREELTQVTLFHDLSVTEQGAPFGCFIDKLHFDVSVRGGLQPL